MAYELLGGAPPFESDGSPMAVMYRHVSEAPPPLAAVDPRLAAWVGRLLEKRPEARPAGAAQAWAELEELVVDILGPYWRRDAALGEDGEAPDAATTTAAPRVATIRRPPAPTPLQPASPRRRRRVPLAGAAALLALGGAAAVLALDGDDRRRKRPARRPTPAARPATAAPFDFDGDGDATAAVGVTDAGRRGAGVVVLPQVSNAASRPPRPQCGARLRRRAGERRLRSRPVRRPCGRRAGSQHWTAVAPGGRGVRLPRDARRTARARSGRAPVAGRRRSVPLGALRRRAGRRRPRRRRVRRSRRGDAWQRRLPSRRGGLRLGRALSSATRTGSRARGPRCSRVPPARRTLRQRAGDRRRDSRRAARPARGRAWARGPRHVLRRHDGWAERLSRDGRQHSGAGGDRGRRRHRRPLRRRGPRRARTPTGARRTRRGARVARRPRTARRANRSSITPGVTASVLGEDQPEDAFGAVRRRRQGRPGPFRRHRRRHAGREHQARGASPSCSATATGRRVARHGLLGDDRRPAQLTPGSRFGARSRSSTSTVGPRRSRGRGCRDA